MAAQRYISTSFWDDEWVQNLAVNKKLIYMYLLTNPLTNIAGVYKITARRMAFDTGVSEKTLIRILDEFAEAGKAYYFSNEWIILPNWPKHQQADKRAKIRAGIDNILSDLPEPVWNELLRIGYRYPFIKEVIRHAYDTDTLSISYAYESNYSDSDLDIDLDLDEEEDIRACAREESSSSSSDMVIYFLQIYNQAFGESLEVTDLTAEEVKALACLTPPKIDKIISNVVNTPYLRERNSIPFIAKYALGIYKDKYKQYKDPPKTRSGTHDWDEETTDQQLWERYGIKR